MRTSHRLLAPEKSLRNKRAGTLDPRRETSYALKRRGGSGMKEYVHRKEYRELSVSQFPPGSGPRHHTPFIPVKLGRLELRAH